MSRDEPDPTDQLREIITDLRDAVNLYTAQQRENDQAQAMEAATRMAVAVLALDEWLEDNDILPDDLRQFSGGSWYSYVPTDSRTSRLLRRILRRDP